MESKTINNQTVRFGNFKLDDTQVNQLCDFVHAASDPNSQGSIIDGSAGVLQGAGYSTFYV